MSQKKSGKSTKKNGRKKKSQSKLPTKGNKIILLVLTVAVIATGITLYTVFSLQPVPNRAASTAASSVSSQQETSSPNSVKDAINYSGQQNRIYEENVDEGFLNRVRQVDQALLQSLLILDVDPDKVKHKEMQLKKHADSSYYHQTLVLTLTDDLQEKFISGFRSYLQKWFKKVRVEPADLKDQSFRVSVNGVPTHLLILQTRPMRETARDKKKPKIAIVIDDMGENIHKAERLYQILGNSVSFSILPHSTYSRQVANLAARKDIPVLLHQPMEPLQYPEVDPGPGTLLVEMSNSRIKSVLTSNLNSVPGVIGVNNHMGSRFTSSESGMRVVLKELKKRNLFFMDSLTSSRSKGNALASRIGVKEVNRDIFLDNEQDEKAILFQLQKAVRLAKKAGNVVAIGHPYPETLNALNKWSKQRGEKFRLCSIAEIVDSEN